MHINTTDSQVVLFKSERTTDRQGVNIRFEDRVMTVPQGTTVAAALLLNGAGPFRTTPVKSSPRAPYCMMGVCFECLVEIDGKQSRQACLTIVREGMHIKRQLGASELDLSEEQEHGI